MVGSNKWRYSNTNRSPTRRQTIRGLTEADDETDISNNGGTETSPETPVESQTETPTDTSNNQGE